MRIGRDLHSLETKNTQPFRDVRHESRSDALPHSWGIHEDFFKFSNVAGDQVSDKASDGSILIDGDPRPSLSISQVR